MAQPAVTTSTVRTVRDWSSQRGWTSLSLLTLILVIAPVLALFVTALSPDFDLWRQQIASRLPAQLFGTVAVMFGVGTLALLIGSSLAWLVTAYRFPGSTLFSWLLAVPLAMPGYILGFVTLAVFGFTGPVQQTWRSWFGQDAWFPEVRSTLGVIVVLGLVLYPYVFLLTRAALKDQAGAAYHAARSLGVRPIEAARRVVFPMLRPALAASLAIVMMETLTDFATVEAFGVDTVSVGVYKLLVARGDREAANQLSLAVFAFAMFVIFAERMLRGRASFSKAGSDTEGFTPRQLSGLKAYGATGACLAVLTIAFAAPVAQLLAWMRAESQIDRGTPLTERFVEFASNSMLLAASTATVCVIVSVLLTNTARLSPGPIARLAVRAATIGYSLPGSIIAIGVLMVLVAVDRTGLLPQSLLLTGSVASLIYGCSVRYLGPGLTTIESGLTQVGSNLTDSARSLGAGPLAIARRVHLPLSKSSVLTAVVLVSVDTIKELPIVLLLRPFGFDTLSVWVWNLSSESRFTQAALPALVIVLLAALPVILLSRRLVRPAN